MAKRAPARRRPREAKPATSGCRVCRGVYHPILRRLEIFTDDPLGAALEVHEMRAGMVLERRRKGRRHRAKAEGPRLAQPVSALVRGGALRWLQREPPPLEQVLKTMQERAAKFNTEKIKPQDLAGAAGPPDEEG